MNVLVIEDGYEYIETVTEFLADGFVWTRAGSGPEALTALPTMEVDAIYLDMRFDRCPLSELLGDVTSTAEQFNGDEVQARRHLERHQGLHILAAVRAAGHTVPVLLSYDFASEPKRFERLRARYGPVAFVADNEGPKQVAAALKALIQRTDGRC